jgi:4-hydroxyisophthalate hydroxylase
MASGRNVYEALGPGFTLLALDGDTNAVQTFERVAADLHLPLSVLEDPGQGETARYGARLVLVRPDQFVAWTSASPTLGVDEARRLLHRVTGRPAPDLAGV